jgi:hypothetical protein
MSSATCRFKLFMFLTVLISLNITGQTSTSYKNGTLFRMELSSSMFPDSERMNGHKYRDNFYSFEEHYNDSTTLVYVPDNVSLDEEFEIVVFFHGWWNNVDSSLVGFNLAEQLYTSKRNAILILPEGPKNSADSYGGKFEQAGQFKKYVNEVLDNLPIYENRTAENFSYIFGGHSGANRVMAYILMHGGLTDQIKEVYLFDGLYSHVEKYCYWLDNFDGRFINIFTPDGGTKNLSENLMVSLNAWGLPFSHIKTDDFTNEALTQNRIVIIESELGHNDVIYTKKQFQKFLETGAK